MFRLINFFKRALLLLLFVGATELSAEGTGQVMPNSSDGTALVSDPSIGIGSYRSCPSNRRIRINIKDFNTERLYFGLHGRVRQPSDGALTNGYYRIFNPSGTQVVGATAIPTSGTGFISTYAAAVAGPVISGSPAGGYTPRVFTPAVNGDFWIEIYRSNNGGATPVTTNDAEAYFIYFDFTVATAAGVRYPGRIHCQEWAFITYDPSGVPYTPNGTNSFRGRYFGYTPDSNIVAITYQNQFRPFRFTVAMNYEGVTNTSNFINDRRSVHTGATNSSISNPYRVFLYRPDSTVWPRALSSASPALTGNIYGCPGGYFIPYYLQKSGDVSILLDFNGVAGYQPGSTDVTLEAFTVPQGNNIMSWNGLNGLGSPVTSGVSVSVTVNVFLGRTNIPMYDAELNLNGLSISSIHPSIVNRTMYWDDSNLAPSGACNTSGNNELDNNSQSGGIAFTNLLNGIVGPSHAWDATSPSTAVPAPSVGGQGANSAIACDDYGNARTINTWIYSNDVSSTPVRKLTPSCNKDGDGVVDAVDIDDDNDGILDANETPGLPDPLGDADSDGFPNYLDPSAAGFLDVSFDGIDDRYDFDNDGIINSFDIDSDNDGVTDVVESGASDPDNNGIIGTGAVPTDTDNDGLANVVDATPGSGAAGSNGTTARNTDGDARLDITDIDSDNDGILDVEENFVTDVNSDGVVDGVDVDGDGLFSTVDQNDLVFGDPGNTDNAPDFDGDGLPNFRDLDSDNDGINDLVEQGVAGSNVSIVDANGDGVVDGADADNDGLRDSADSRDNLYGDPDTGDSPIDTDGDGRPNFTDLDSDNDAIHDLTEQGTAGSNASIVDANSDGVVDGSDADGDGIRDSADANDAAYGDADTGDSPVDRDSDGIVDMLDLDTDNDGIHDLIESGHAGLVDANSDGTVDGPDSDNDGIRDSADSNDALYGDPDTTDAPTDRDSDGVQDYRDLDSDNDGINDLSEGWPTGVTDANGDGVVDGSDADGDGIRDSADNNDALFGDPDLTDGPMETDGDGIFNFRDLDSDNDGMNDLNEQGTGGSNASITDANSDGVVDGADADGDGIRDSADANDAAYGDADTGDSPVDRDSDGLADMIDLDSDNDGIHDLVEIGTLGSNASIVDANSDGVVDGPDTDGDGIRDSADANDGVYGDADSTDTPNDRDSDGVPDYRDLDSDNDGINDLSEGWPTGIVDADSDGVVDGPDTDGDGIRDSADNNDATYGDPDTTDGPLDTDGDGIFNFRDLDSDNDGVNDLTEGGSTGITDANGDGVVDGTDADGDGIRDSADNNDATYGDPDTTDGPLDTDGDGIFNANDLDSDNDAIHDLTEQGTAGSNASIVDANSDGVVDGSDADGDGIRDSADANDAAYGDADTGDSPVDRDSDGIVDMLDLDTDNDGIHDLIESGHAGLVDANSDGTVDGPDSDNDGIRDSADSNDALYGDPDTTDAPTDRDSDGVQDYRDLDSDNDGINDLSEGWPTGVTDANGDGVVDGSDADGDGIRDSADNNDALFGDPDLTDGPMETDGDGIFNFRDLDSDNDGMNDLNEQGTGGSNASITDANSDGVVDGADADGDGIRDSADANDAAYGDADTGDSPVDRDSDGLADMIDLDSDNDGIHDLVEIGTLGSNASIVDANSDGVVDGPDTDGDGIRDSADANDGVYGDADSTDTPNDRDSDGVPDYRDLDSDNDGINDLSEGWPTGIVDADSDGVVDGPDTDGDGIRDSADNNDATYGDPDTTDGPLDTDGDGIFNFRDLDSDNDGVNDLTEGGSTGITDANGDGVVDGTDADGDGIRDSADNNDATYGDPDTTDGPLDTDGDGIFNANDLDSDNDAIHDLTEQGTAGSNASIVDANSDGVVDGSDADGDGIRDSADANDAAYGDADTGDSPVDRDSDGIVDMLDLDTDNDGIHDLVESGFTGLTDVNSDGVVDGPDSDGDGIRDSADSNDALYGDPDTTDVLSDKDGDGVQDYRDLDSDNDGINDITESGETGIVDANSDGVVDGPDTDGDGIRDSADANDALFGDPNLNDGPVDTDGDGKFDFRDLDSDQDGILDLTESRNTVTDADSDGVVDGPDTDGDGIRDSADNNDGVYGDPDAGDTPPDSDGDGVMDFRDLDSDNDSVNDIVEGGSGAFDSNSDGLVDGNDNDGDGVNDPVDANDSLYGDPDSTDTPPSQDGGPTPDYLDLDSDGDGIFDVIEAGNGAFDTNNDGRVDGGDADNDGIKDVVDEDDTRFGESAVPLPITLVEFNALKESNNVRVYWKTASELNSDYYVISRSLDGVDFSAIERVKSYNKSNGASYSILDKSPSTGINYYKLTSFDFDGSSETSPIVSVLFGSNEKLFLVYQANQNLVVKPISGLSDVVNIKLLSATGQTIRASLSSNTTYFEENIEGLSEGVYLVQIETITETIVRKIILKP